jgi:hypothetical protein
MYMGELAGCREVPELICPRFITFDSLAPRRTPIRVFDITMSGPILISPAGLGDGAGDGLGDGLADGMGMFISVPCCGDWLGDWLGDCLGDGPGCAAGDEAGDGVVFGAGLGML